MHKARRSGPQPGGKFVRRQTLEPPPRIQARDVDAAVKYIRKAKRGAPGRDGLPGWVYCLLDYAQLRATMKKILQIVTFAGIPPRAWAELRVVPVFKDGDSLDVGRYRPITLLVVLAKAVESVIKALAERMQQKTLHPSIMGFTRAEAGSWRYSTSWRQYSTDSSKTEMDRPNTKGRIC